MPEIKRERNAQATVAKRDQWPERPSEKFESRQSIRNNVFERGSQSGPSGHGQRPEDSSRSE
jgi:hypothetical protein